MRKLSFDFTLYHKRVHVKKDQQSEWRRNRWCVYCDACEMNEYPVAGLWENNVVARFRSHRAALRAAKRHVLGHLTNRIPYGSYSG